MLQEVAAARNILIKCGSTEIDGYAFCVALTSRSLDLLYKASPNLQSLIRPVTHLIRGAAFRPKKVSRSSGEFSLRIRPLGELIEMYHTRKASWRHDKVFALLGMSCDDPIAADLSPDYEISWGRLLEKLVRSLLGGQVIVKTWTEIEMAVIESKGYILGKVSSVGGIDRNDRREVVITSKDKFGDLEPERKWTLQPSAKSVQVGDLVCLLCGASKPTIIRVCKDHFSIVMISAPLQPEQPITSFPHDFLLVWDWEKFQGKFQDREEYGTLIKSRVPEHSSGELGDHSDNMTRLWNVALILEGAKEYKIAEERLRETAEGYERRFGKEDPQTLTCKDKLAMMHKKAKRCEEAEELSKQPEDHGRLQISHIQNRNDWIVKLEFKQGGSSHLYPCPVSTG